MNSLRLKDSPTYKHHVETYGANFDYYDFAPIFDKAVRQWKPAEWAKLFHNTGARYVVLTTKHHDGFRLWPSRVPNPNRKSESISAKRDLVGELTAAVRAEGSGDEIAPAAAYVNPSRSKLCPIGESHDGII